MSKFFVVWVCLADAFFTYDYKENTGNKLFSYLLGLFIVIIISRCLYG